MHPVFEGDRGDRRVTGKRCRFLSLEKAPFPLGEGIIWAKRRHLIKPRSDSQCSFARSSVFFCTLLDGFSAVLNRFSAVLKSFIKIYKLFCDFLGYSKKFYYLCRQTNKKQINNGKERRN
jgi:hypothetical protein